MGVREALTSRIARAGLALIVALAACRADGGTGPGGGDPGDHPAFPGFDTSLYPGDAALGAWQWPLSPYRWVGYYLGGPCHRDQTWRGRRTSLAGSGWGIAALYVGQQDWSQIAANLLPSLTRIDVMPVDDAGQSATLVTCSASLLTDAQGRAEAADAVDRMAADGFPVGSAVFLDVEHVTAVNDALLTYVRAWVSAIASAGGYRAGVYMSRSNAPVVSAAARAAWTAAGAAGSPAFWIAASSSSLHFSLDSRPTDVGYDYASIWQGRLDVTEIWSGIQLPIDVNVASALSPSAPGAAAQTAVALTAARTDP